MSTLKEFESQALRWIVEELEQAELPVLLHEPDANTPIPVAVVLMEGLGKKSTQHYKLELMFLPVQESDREAFPFNFLQFYTILAEKREPADLSALLTRLNQINATLPAGSFGWLEEGQVLYLKYCCPYPYHLGKAEIIELTQGVLAMLTYTLTVFGEELAGE